MKRDLIKILIINLICLSTKVHACIKNPQETNVPQEAKKWKAELQFINLDEKQKEKIHIAVKLIKQVISSKEFKSRILQFGVGPKVGFMDNNGLCNDQIYEKIIEGAEMIEFPQVNYSMDVEIELYQHQSNTIGYTYPDSKRIWINQKYFDSFAPAQVAENLMHEWMHKLGFDHAIKWNSDRDYSVPYAIGSLIRELADSNLR